MSVEALVCGPRELGLSGLEPQRPHRRLGVWDALEHLDVARVRRRAGQPLDGAQRRVDTDTRRWHMDIGAEEALSLRQRGLRQGGGEQGDDHGPRHRHVAEDALVDLAWTD